MNNYDNGFSKAQQSYDRMLPPDNDETVEEQLERELDKADQDRDLELDN